MADRALEKTLADREMDFQITDIQKRLARVDVQFGHGMPRPRLSMSLALPMATQGMIATHLPPCRRLLVTVRHHLRTALGKAATSWHR